MKMKTAVIQSNLLGHQGTCFELRSYNDPRYLLSASEDGSGKLWDTQNKKCISTFLHNKDCEVLRIAHVDNHVLTAGSDGNIKIWNCPKEQIMLNQQGTSFKPSLSKTLDHEAQHAQIYVCEVNALNPNIVLTAADSDAFVWDIEQGVTISKYHYLSSLPESQSFGGTRNPQNEVYIFDAKWNPQIPHQAALALSDGTIRLLDTRNPNDTGMILSLSDEEDSNKIGTTTSVNWNSEGTLCSISFGSGKIAILDLRKGECLGLHQFHSKTCFGAKFLDDTQILSWSADSTIGLWDYQHESNECNNLLHFFNRNYLQVPNFNILSCFYNSDKDIIYCGGHYRNVSSNHSFLGVPILAITPQ